MQQCEGLYATHIKSLSTYDVATAYAAPPPSNAKHMHEVY